MSDEPLDLEAARPIRLDTEEDGGEGSSHFTTPMLDVLFILLIFFLCVSQVRRERLDLKIEVPEVPATAADPVPEMDAIHVEIARGGAIFLAAGREDGVWEAAGRTPLTRAQLEKRLREVKMRTGGETSVVLAGDRAVPHGDVAWVLGLLSELGFAHIEMTVEPEKEATR